MNAPETDRHLLSKSAYIYMDAKAIIGYCLKKSRIGNGTDASTAFYSLGLLDNKKEIQTLREGLLKYCELDTWAMVRILEKLHLICN